MDWPISGATAARNMNVFALRDAVTDEYKKFATSFTPIHAEDIQQQVNAIYSEGRFWPEPLIQINPTYKRTATIDSLDLHPGCSQIFRTGPTPDAPNGKPLTLYQHQQEAIEIAQQGESFVVTTGTGSGKSLCFFIPIIDAVLKEKKPGQGTRAVIIYPMNALANSQIEELDKYVGNVIGDRPITYDRYTGQEKQDERLRIAANPPDILLTNFMMLELLMTRQEELDRQVIDNCKDLRFLVLDELHTYRGRQGADVALLVRRVRERLAPKKLQCIGTSATMASEGSREEKNRVVADVATRLFAVNIPPSNVIVETLERVTENLEDEESFGTKLGATIDAGVQEDITDQELCGHPLAVWVERRLGLDWQEGRWVRAHPLTVTEAVAKLSENAGRSTSACEKALRDFLLVSSLPETERLKAPAGNPRGFFAFKLHQFFSGAGRAYATLEAPGRRVITVEEQQFLPSAPHKRLYATYFCRGCGQEYHPVKKVREGTSTLILARDIEDAPIARPGDADLEDQKGENRSAQGETFGFLTLHPCDEEFKFENRAEDYPENWLESDTAGNQRIKAYYRHAKVEEIHVDPEGKVGNGNRAWLMPGKFRFCLRCLTTQGGATKDRNRLASLSAEGRSSATTILAGSTLRWMHRADSGLSAEKRKLLAFTDNRQDAALQAGHFNDFHFVSLVRAAFLGALEKAGHDGLSSDELGVSLQRNLGFDRQDSRTEWLIDPLKPGAAMLLESEKTLREVLAYRAWFDQRRGWRYTNPNLEQLGLLEVRYYGLNEFVEDDSVFAATPILRDASTEVRAAVYHALLDHMRMRMAVKCRILESATIEQIRDRAHRRLRPPWSFDKDEALLPARWLFVTSPPRVHKLRDELLIARGGSRSALGKVLKSWSLWDNRDIQTMKGIAIDQLIEAMLRAAQEYGFVSLEPTPFGQDGWQLADIVVRFHKKVPEEDTNSSKDNAFYRQYYNDLAQLLRTPKHPLFEFEAREHTAQVDSEERQRREKRFRHAPRSGNDTNANSETISTSVHSTALVKQSALVDPENSEKLENIRFLPLLFCSPTMELGVDIAALNVVYMRNVPPTPANYAQRSGRAGRGGQAALVLTYCSALGPHDQYFFRHPKQMVHGEVRPPALDLANRELVDSHLHAVWLACSKTALDGSISKILDLNVKARPLLPEVEEPLRRAHVSKDARHRIRNVLAMLEDDLTQEHAPWYHEDRDAYADAVVENAADRFNHAFSRWRDLFVAAEEQREASRTILDDYATTQNEKNAAKSRHDDALKQLELLQKGDRDRFSDFYTYRYLATEGFLPGYNFPRLPLMAYIPETSDGGRQAFIRRPRFIALAEFGPRSLIYHEGRSFRVVRALFALGQEGGTTAEAKLPTKTVRICRSCGAGHFEDTLSMCQGCGTLLREAEIVNSIYHIKNVATQPTERISANDEERLRQGFELQTTFQWAVRDGAADVRRAVVKDNIGHLAHLSYGPGATITRINKGLRRRVNKKEYGFNIDPVSGYWAKAKDENDDGPQDPTRGARQKVVPYVSDQKNSLLFQPEEDLEPKTLTTLLQALLRGIETYFQLEQGEVLAEPMPSRERRKGCLFYEAAEGGAGVLTRLVAEPGAMAHVARVALSVLHFDVDKQLPEDPAHLTSVDDARCVAACYRCLMSYYNQPDHDLLDRRDDKAQEILLRLAHARTSPELRPTNAQTGVEDNVSTAQELPQDKDALARWRALAVQAELPPPDQEPVTHDGVTLPLVWRSHYLVAAFEPLSPATVVNLENRGFEVVVVGDHEAQWNETLPHLAQALQDL